MCVPEGSPVTVSDAGQAVAAVRAGLGFLAGMDARELTGAEQADLLRALAGAESMQLAAASNVLMAFTFADHCLADAHRTARSWLRWQTRATTAAAGGAVGWAWRLRRHPHVAAALAAGTVSPSWARHLCDWTDPLPSHAVEDADVVLLAAAAGGADLPELAALAEEIARRNARPDTDTGDASFTRRKLRLTGHYQGHAVLDGDLTPAAAQALRAVLDALGSKTGPEDTRSQAERDHDALEQACRMLIAAGFLPDRAGQPTHIQLHLTLSQLLHLPEADQALAAWVHTAGPASPPGADCDATIIPIVTTTPTPEPEPQNDTAGSSDSGIAGNSTDGAACGGVDSTDGAGCGSMDGTGCSGSGVDSRACSNMDGTACSSTDGAGCSGNDDAAGSLGADCAGDRCGQPASPDDGTGSAAAGADSGNNAGTAAMARRAAWQLSVSQAIDLLSGPGGLASWLRTQQLGGPAGTISLPLDVGTATETIPAHIRRAVTRRDQHCRFPGCTQRPAACQVHHLIPRSEGGPTSLANCILLCTFHHLIAIHRWRWQLFLNPDGTTTARDPAGIRTLHSHPPPVQAA